MIILILAAAVLSSALCVPAWWLSGRRGYLYPWEPALPALPVLLWLLVTYLGIGAQSLGNLVELPLVIAIFTAMVYLKSFAFRRWGIPKRTAAVILAALAALIPLALRLSFPWMPE